MKTIGILGGLGPESTAAYYNIITRNYYRLKQDYAYPEIVVYSVSFQEYIGAGYEAAEQVADVIRRLHLAGADFVVAACNSIHIVYDEVRGNIPIPWVSIMDATAEAIQGAGMRRVGLLGTIFTMGGGFYQKAFDRYGIETMVPDQPTQKRVNEIIYGELVLAEVLPESKQYGLQCVEQMAADGAEGIVLGCTELPFLIQQQDTPVPVFDTTAIHADKALRLALEEE